MDLKLVNQSIVSVILTLNDSKNLYSKNHAYTLRMNGHTITNTSGIAFSHQGTIYIVCDGNIFTPYYPKSYLNANTEDPKITIQFSHHQSSSSQNDHTFTAQLLYLEHLDYIQSQILSIDHSFKFGPISHPNSNSYSHLHGLAHFALLKLSQSPHIPTIQPLLLTLQSLHKSSSSSSPSSLTSSRLLGESIFSISNPFGILCSNVLNNSVHHGILSTNIPIKNGQSIWLSDMNYLPGMEGGIVLSSNSMHSQFIGILSIPLILTHSAMMTTIIPSSIVMEWIIQQIGSDHSDLKISNFGISPNLQNSDVDSQRDSIHSNPLNSVPTQSISNLDALNMSTVYQASRSVVPIMIGSHWGSAIMINKDNVFTNAHIIRPYLKDKEEKNRIKRNALKGGDSPRDHPKIGIAIDFMDGSAMSDILNMATRITQKDYRIGSSVNTITRKWVRCELMFVAHSQSPWDIAWLRIIGNADHRNKFDDDDDGMRVNHVDHQQFVHPVTVKNASVDIEECDSSTNQPLRPNHHLNGVNKPKQEMNMEYKRLFERREKIFAIGYGLIHPSNGLSPVVSSGVISRNIYDDVHQNVVMLKTSADIHGGHSGGLLCDEQGYCLGILTNNAVFDFDTKDSAVDTWEKQKLWNEGTGKDSGSNKISVIYPHLNSALPFSIVYDLYRCIVEEGKSGNDRLEMVLTKLDEPNVDIQAKWNLIAPERLQNEIRYDRKMKHIMSRIPKEMLKKSKKAKL